MKTFRLLAGLLTAVLLSMTFFSCSDDDDDINPDKIAGTWIITQSKGYELNRIDGKEEKYEFDEEEDDRIIDLRDNGKYYTGYKTGTLSYIGEWNYKNGYLIFTYDDDDYSDKWKVLSVSSSELIMEMHEKNTETYKGIEYYYEYYVKYTLKKQ